MSKYAKLSAGLLAAWLVFALSSSALHLYVNAPEHAADRIRPRRIDARRAVPGLVRVLAGIPAVRSVAEPARPHAGAKRTRRRHCVPCPGHL